MTLSFVPDEDLRGRNVVPLQLLHLLLCECSLSLLITFHEFWPEKHPSPSKVHLCAYSEEAIPAIGSMDVRNWNTRAKEPRVTPGVVVKGDRPSLFGRNCLKHLRLDWQEIHHVHSNSMESVLEKHKTLLQPGLGTLKGHKGETSSGPWGCATFSQGLPHSLCF